MPPRLKKLIGFFAFLPALALYFVAAAALGERVPNIQILKVLYFIAAGIAWAFPARYLMRWMEAEPKRSAPREG
ncbi:MAG: DUF2842 domain-containing protein [Parvularculaceae bacterium]